MQKRHDSPSPRIAHKGQDPDLPNALQGHGKNLGLRSEPTTTIGSSNNYSSKPQEISKGGFDISVRTGNPKSPLPLSNHISHTIIANFGDSPHRFDDS